ncbi:MAG: penicillin-binding protein activator [Legionellales bacterium]
MLKQPLQIKIVLLLLSTLFLCHCTQAINTPAPAVEPVVLNKKLISPYSHKASAYLAQAKTQAGDEKQQSMLLAAGRLIDSGQWQQGAAILAQTHELSVIQMDEKKILLAKIDLINDRSKAALAKLTSIQPAQNNSLFYQVQLHELLAQAYRAEKNPSAAIAERIQLAHLLTDASSQITNERLLWLTLTNISAVELSLLAEKEANHAEFEGWLQLALISRNYRDHAPSLLAALDNWQTQYSTHPANRLLPNPLDSIANKMLSKPKQVALLLPVSGALAGPGAAIKEGFMAAYKLNDNRATTKIKVYDTNKGLITDTYQQALADGADFVIGPLTKTHVAAIAAINHPVPTLLLNDADVALQENAYLYSLSPANEATQVAIKAKSKGYGRALIIAAKGNWSDEVVQAFKQQWLESGGQVADTYFYTAGADINKGMRDLLQITDSQQREQRLKAVLGQKLQSSTNRRQDFDMIFLLAYPSKARQIMPLLNYYYAGDVPVYATSSVYSGNANALKDKDLDGVIFCDIPWVFSHQMGIKNWPEQFNSYNRLYALGMDSYALVSQLNQLILFPADGSGDASGTLYLKPSQQITRVLEWGQFRQGLAHSLGVTT